MRHRRFRNMGNTMRSAKARTVSRHARPFTGKCSVGVRRADVVIVGERGIRW